MGNIETKANGWNMGEDWKRKDKEIRKKVAPWKQQKMARTGGGGAKKGLR